MTKEVSQSVWAPVIWSVFSRWVSASVMSVPATRTKSPPYCPVRAGSSISTGATGVSWSSETFRRRTAFSGASDVSAGLRCSTVVSSTASAVPTWSGPVGAVGASSSCYFSVSTVKVGPLLLRAAGPRTQDYRRTKGTAWDPSPCCVSTIPSFSSVRWNLYYTMSNRNR